MSKATTEEQVETIIGGLKVKKVSTLTEPNSMLIYGKEKTGKSTLAASISQIPGYEKVLVIDVDNGATAFSSFFPDVDVVTPELHDVDSVTDVLNEIRNHPTGMGYRAVIVDTFSILAEWAMRAISRGNKPEFDDWAALKDWAVDTMWDLHHMKPLGISLFHSATKEVGVLREVSTGPKIAGSAFSSVGAIPDLIGQLSITNKGKGYVRSLRLHPSETITAGSRFPDLPQERLADATMENLFAFIRGEDNWQTAPPSLLERFEAGDIAAGEPQE